MRIRCIRILRETLKAAEALVADGFTVLPYIGDDPVVCKQLEEVGCVAVMPLAAPIGSGLGVCNPYTIRIIKERASVPVIVDAGVGTASDAAIAMELGVDALLMNTGIAAAKDPVLMAEAMKNAVLAGRQAFLAGRMEKRSLCQCIEPDARPDRNPDESMSQEIDVNELARWRSEGKTFVLLDVREPSEIAAASLPDAVHIPMREVPHRMGELPKDEPIAVLCHHGGRSAQVAQLSGGARL